jgi:hypothetical protein
VPVSSGHFQLYSRIEPPLKAGDYKFRTEQHLNAAGHPETELAVDPLDTHVRVRSPQYALPPDQVLSTYPPAGREGSFGARLPQIVIRRRTLPWERRVAPGRDELPWLALVLIAEGEAELVMNAPVAQCVTPGVELDTPTDVERGNYLKIRKSTVHTIFPTQEEVGLLAHAREVDINDTELMMGDDDGFLAVVVGNRLPLPGRDGDGNEAPVKYCACLVNLCEQLPSLLDKAPEPVDFFVRPEIALESSVLTLADSDHFTMGTLGRGASQQVEGLPKAVSGALRKGYVDPQVAAPFEAAAGWTVEQPSRGTADIYAQMASGFVISDIVADVVIDPELRFPVLIHWSFTSTGDETFESLMKGLGSGLLGTTGDIEEGDVGARPPTTGRLPLEVVETGHVGLPHRLREGDEVRSWYRGPLLPHPPDAAADRLPLAHAADQVRVVVPDGREDLSLAAAFEVGRLLGLSRTSMVAALMRWRQLGFQAARRSGIFRSGVFSELVDVGNLVLDRFVGGRIGALVAERIVVEPQDVLGNPDPLVTAGRPVLEDAGVNAVLATGLGLNAKVFDGDPVEVLGNIGGARVRLPGGDVLADPTVSREALGRRLDVGFARAAVQALAPTLDADVLEGGQLTGIPLDLRPDLLGGAVLGGLDPLVVRDRGGLPHGKGVPDALDQLLERLPAEGDDEEEAD